jgi:hypothetical protein
MVASQHPFRSCLTQSGLLPLVASISHLMVASQHPFRIGRTQSPAQQFLLLGFFITRRRIKASFMRLLAIKKPMLVAWAL